jgi:glycosyltransferase involved in cell wall biosynthesis
MYGVLRRGLTSADVARVVHVHLEEAADGLRWAFRHPPEVIVTCATFLAEYVRGCLPVATRAATRVVAIPNAVDLDRFAPAPKDEAKRRIGAPTSRPLVLMLANLAPHKGLETAIRAISLLKARGVDVTCWMAGAERGGPGAYTRRMTDLVTEAEVADRVTFLGQRSDPDQLLRAADFLLLPSTQEGLPLSILEAQASKVCVLAAPTAGIPEVVRDGETGFLIAATDAEGYAWRLEHLIRHPGMRGAVTEAAFQCTTRDNSWAAYCRKIDAVYDEAIEIRRTRRRSRFRFRPWRTRVDDGRPPRAVADATA